MERRGRKNRVQTSPERNKIWVEPNSKNHANLNLQQVKKVAVVYYLCKNRHLEHPHFIEVPLSSYEGLYLRDVINRLNVLRGKSMASMYSWSCKRTYKNGFVWHDLSKDDLVLPAHGNEYILKGSEILDQSPPDQSNQNSVSPKFETLKNRSPQIGDSPKSSGTHDTSSSSSSPILTKQDKKHVQVQDEEQYNIGTSTGTGTGTSTPHSISSGTSSPNLNEYRVIKPIIAQNASTQTEESKNRQKQTLIPIPSTNFSGEQTLIQRKNRRKQTPITLPNSNSSCEHPVPNVNSSSEQTLIPVPNPNSSSEITLSPVPNPNSPSASSSVTSTKIDTLESLIRAEASQRNKIRVSQKELSEETLKPSNLLMQLITCNRGFGLVPSYRPRFTQLGFPSPVPVFGTEIKLNESLKNVGLKVEEAEFFSERNKVKEEDNGFKRSNSFEERAYKATMDSKCLPQTIKKISCKYPRGITLKSPQGPNCNNKLSPQGPDCNYKLSPASSSKGASKRTVLSNSPSNLGSNSSRLNSFNKDKEKTIQIEES